MASFRKRGRTWRVEVCRNGGRRSATFNTKAEAAAWAAKIEAELVAGRNGRIPADKTFGDLLERYRDEVSSTKRGRRREFVLIERMLRGRLNDDPPKPPDPIVQVRLVDLDASHFAAWRDRRLKEVSPATVLREWNLLSAATYRAVREWKWLPDNPMKEVKRPAAPPPRERRISDEEIGRLLTALGYDRDSAPVTQSARIGAAFLFAIETAMRMGEIAHLEWRDVHLDQRYLVVRGDRPGAGKTRAAHRQVPLSSEAIRILRQMQSVRAGGESVFRLTTQSFDALFRKARARAMIENLHFHDTRHEAITRLAKKIDVLDLARMVGHKDLRQLMVYYNASASEIADRIG